MAIIVCLIFRLYSFLNSSASNLSSQQAQFAGDSQGLCDWHGSCLARLLCVFIQPHVLDTASCALHHDRKDRGQIMLVPSPKWLDSGNNAWQLAAATFVGLQSIPGLTVLYAGIVKKKWAINSAFMAFYAFAATLITWVVWAYKIGFGKQMLPLAGIPGPIIAMNDELKQALLPTSGITANFPMSTMVYFQFVFAAITVVIMAG